MFLRNTASSSGTHLLLMGPQPTRLQRHSWETQDSMSPSCQAVPRGRGPHWAFGFFMTPLCPQPQFLTSRSQIWPRWAAWSFAMAVVSHLLTSLAYDALAHTHCVGPPGGEVPDPGSTGPLLPPLLHISHRTAITLQLSRHHVFFITVSLVQAWHGAATKECGDDVATRAGLWS